jgi:hypothetical protein
MSWQETQEVGAWCSGRRRSQPSWADYNIEPEELCGWPGLRPLLIAVGTRTIEGQVKKLPTQHPVMLGNSDNEPNEAGTKSTKL